MSKKYLKLSLDELAEEGFIYSGLDIVGAGHSQTIEAKDKEAFLDDYARVFRDKVESMLKEVEDWEAKELEEQYG